MAFMERRVLTDMFTPQLMGKNKREEGSVEMEDLGSAMCNVKSHHLIVLLLPVCVCLLSHSI